MRGLNGKLTCDAEVRGLNKAWKGCNRSTVLMFERQATTCTLYYCVKHKARAYNPLPVHYTPAPFSTVREVRQFPRNLEVE